MTQTLLDFSHATKSSVARTDVTTPDYVADQRQYRRMYALCFCVFLLVVLVGRLLPRGWRPFALPDGQRGSVLDEARNATATVLPFVFMV
ncbi:MAG: hypothetical protein K2Y51_20645 [Gammaproteobacteria bacterium]|jgi:hypothetical protein|nr:hypothetical protein [Gammaproteobacteria bacterium]